MITYSPERVRICFRRFDCSQYHCLVGLNTGTPVYRMRVAPLKPNVVLGAHPEEGGGHCGHVKALEIDVTAVHSVERASLGKNLIENVHIVYRAISDADKRRNAAVQIEKRVHFEIGRA